MSNRKQSQKDSDALIWIYISLIYLQTLIQKQPIKYYHKL